MPIILKPESTYIVCPVIPLEKSEAKNDAVSPTSLIVTLRLSGEFFST